MQITEKLQSNIKHMGQKEKKMGGGGNVHACKSDQL
jgi:hypothetical protein